MNLRLNKKNMPLWMYNAGEEISSLQVIQTSNNFSSILALGERHLYCFQDNGLVKYMIKFDFMPICFNAYLIGWYYEPGARLLVMVTSEDSKLYVYEGTTLLWSCDLLSTTISVSRCFLKSLPGGLVTLSTDGIVTVCYLGTEPDLNVNVTPMIKDNTDLEEVQAELETVEEALQKIMSNTEDGDNQYPTIEHLIKIKADVGKPVQNLFQQYSTENDASIHLLMCPVVLMLTFEDSKLIQSVYITYTCSPPFQFSESTICLANVNGTEIIETHVFLSSFADISESSVGILLTVTDSSGKIVVLTRQIMLPLSLYCLPNVISSDNEFSLFIEVNQPCIDLFDIITDFSKEDLTRQGCSPSIVTLIYRTTKKTVTVKALKQQYCIESDEFSEITCILQHFLLKLKLYYVQISQKDFKFNLRYSEEFTKKITHKFLKCIETHAKERIILKKCEDELEILQQQFTLIQKKLLVQYGSLPPGDCEPLEFLMKDTHGRIVTTVNEIIRNKETVCRFGSTLAAVGHLVVYILKQSSLDVFKIKLIEKTFSLDSLYEDYQEWEEAVTQALTYVINNIYKKTEKDKEKLAPVTEQGILSHINLKRFLKQIREILDNMFMEVKQTDTQDEKIEKKVERIEELVEVL